jgi:tetratricopeptide (TPR) repeat protein
MDLQQALSAIHAAMQQNRWQQARQIIERALNELGGQSELYSQLAIVSLNLGDSAFAIQQFEKALSLADTVANRCNLASLLCDEQRHAEALELLAPVADAADIDLVQFTLARAAYGLGARDQAMRAIDKAIALAPGDADFRLFRAQMAVDADAWDDAHADLSVLNLQRMTARQLFTVATVLMQTGQFMKAIPLYERLVQQQPGFVDAWLGLAAGQERANNLAAMQSAVERAAALVASPQQQAGLAHLQGKLAARRNAHESACDFLQQAWSAPDGPPLWKSQVGFDLAQSMDKAKRYEQAWQTLNSAHALRNRIRGVSTGDQQALDFFKLLNAPPPEIWPPCLEPGDGNIDPVFVVGFPRSGTTLLEQILDARESLVSFDEQPYLVKTLQRLQSMGIRYPEQLPDLQPAQIRDLRAGYFRQTEAAVPQRGSRRIVDKNPLNWARLPLIQALFPQAKVILALRHPCDVILSCYMQNLRSTVLDGAFSEFARIVGLYVELVRYWQRLQPKLQLPVLHSRYEDLVSDPQTSTQNIAAFLGMEWSEQWLDNTSHARSKAIIHTPSYAQVMEPLNQRAVGRWHHYRAFFDQGLLASLRPSVEAMGYRLD